MRVSWIKGRGLKERGLTALIVTVVTLQGAGAASAQFMQFGPQNQVQPQTPWPAQQQVAPIYIAMAQTGSDSIAADSVPSTPTPDISDQAQEPPVIYQDGPGYQGGCDNDYYTYNTFDSNSGYRYGSYDNNDYGSGCLEVCANSGRRWFGGVYGLAMERSNANRVPLAFVTTNAAPSFPTDAEIALTTRDADIDYQGGLEVRFGAYFGGPNYAWEAAYWGIFEDSATATVTDVTADANRTYGMIDFRGLEFDPGSGFRSVNVFYDSGLPTVDNSAPFDVEVRSLSVRSTFQVQNVEMNLLRLPVLNGGGGSSRYELTTLLGARIMRVDEDFWFRTDYERMDTNALGSLAYDVQTDNTLYGFQIGGNGIYRFGSSGRLSMHCNSTVGLYGNHIEVSQRMNGARFANGANAAFLVESEKDDVSVIGEMRLGVSYQGHPNWRIYGGWRVIGMTGLALSTDQIPTAFVTPNQVGTIASNGSMLLHGLQSGIEFTY